MNGYDYQECKKTLFTEEGMKDYIKVRDAVKVLLAGPGAFSHTGLMEKLSGIDAWFVQAACEYMIEQGELVCLRGKETAWMQFYVFASPKVHNR